MTKFTASFAGLAGFIACLTISYPSQAQASKAASAAGYLWGEEKAPQAAQDPKVEAIPGAHVLISTARHSHAGDYLLIRQEKSTAEKLLPFAQGFALLMLYLAMAVRFFRITRPNPSPQIEQIG